MKKICIILFACLLFCGAAIPATAADAPFADAYSLYSYWEENDAYPDYVSGVWSTDGGIANLTFGVLDTEEGNRGKDEILALIANDTTVSFAYGVNSYNYLKDVMDGLTPFFESNRGLVSGGVDVYTGTITLGIHEDRKNDPDTLAMLEEIYDAFGRDVFTVVYTELIVHTLDSSDRIYVTIDANEPRAWFGYALAGVLFLTLAAAVVIKVRRASVLQTNTGDVLTGTDRPTAREVEQAVKESSVQAPPTLDEKVFDSLPKDN